MAATYVQILKELTRQTTIGSKTWQSTVDGNSGKIENESHVIIPNVNTNDFPPTLFAWVQLKNKLLVPDSFFGKIISAGQEVQTLTQVGGSNTLTITQTGVSNSTITSARIYTDGGHVELKWNSCNTPSTSGGGGGNGTGAPCQGDPTRNNENAHRMIANYKFRKQDGNVGELTQIYHTGKTPWLEGVVPAGYGVAVINGPKFKGSVIKTKKMIVFKNDNQMDFVLEPDDSSPEGKELNSLLTAITKQVSTGFAASLGL